MKTWWHIWISVLHYHKVHLATCKVMRQSCTSTKIENYTTIGWTIELAEFILLGKTLFWLFSAVSGPCPPATWNACFEFDSELSAMYHTICNTITTHYITLGNEINLKKTHMITNIKDSYWLRSFLSNLWQAWLYVRNQDASPDLWNPHHQKTAVKNHGQSSQDQVMCQFVWPPCGYRPWWGSTPMLC